MRLKYLLLSLSLLFTIAVSAQTSSQQNKNILTYADRMPEPGFDLSKYLSENLHYPDTARVHNIEGRVLIKFVINEDGDVSDYEVIKSIGGGCDEEALRVVKNMPKWIPGKQDGKAVKVYFNLPVVFKLED